MGWNSKINSEIIFRTLKIIIESSPKWTIWRLALILLEGIIPLANIYLLKLVVDEIVKAINSNQIEGALNSIMLLILGWASVNIIASFTRTFSLYVNTAQQQLLSDYIQNIIHTKASTIDYQFFEDHEYYDNFHRVRRESVSRCNQLITNIAQVARSGISLIGLIVILFTLHWAVLLILMITILPMGFIRFVYANKIHKWRKTRTPTNRKAGNYSQILTGATYAKELRLFNRAEEFIANFKTLRVNLFKEKLSLDYLKAKREILSGLAEASALVGVAYFVIDQGISGQITIGSIVMYFQAFQRGQTFLRNTVQGVLSIYESRLFLEHLYEFLDLNLIIHETKSPVRVPSPIRKVEFDNVTFKYPFGKGNVLQNVSFEVRSSQILAVVGRNGSGKSTLAKLLCRLYDPTNGQIKVNEIDIRDTESQDWRKQISPLFQDYSKYNLSLRLNITGDDSMNKTQVIDFINKAGAGDIYDQLGKNLSVPLGKIFNHSRELSEGQWQRIALTRSLAKDAPILILDEPTSHMDGDSESKFLKKLQVMRKDKIIILITHRSTNVKLADHVIIMDNGKIIDSGKHQELYRRSYLYQSLFNPDEGKEIIL